MLRDVLCLRIPDDGRSFDTESVEEAESQEVSEGMLVAKFRKLIAESLNIDRVSIRVYPANIPYNNVDELEAQRRKIQNSEIKPISSFDRVNSYLEPWSDTSIHFLFSVSVETAGRKGTGIEGTK
jgi:hypothetical protein